MMKRAIFLLVLVAFSFCAETATERYDDALYMIYAGGFDYLNVYPYMEFTATMRLSVDDPDTRVVYAGPGGSRSDLQDNAIVCEGPVTAHFTPAGIWARDDNLEQTLNYYQCDPPSHTGGVNGDRPIVWSSSIYDAFYSQETCTDDESCWGRLSGLVLQPADFVRSGEWFYTRESKTNVVCKGTTSLREGSTLLSSSVIEGTPITNTNTYLRGTHTFTGQMDIDGCAAVVRHPECSTPGYVGREEIYSRTEAQSGTGAPQYSGVAGPVSINIRSVTTADLRCSAEFVSVVPSPLVVDPGESTSATVTIRNNCPASDQLCQNITVDTITVSDGFTFTYEPRTYTARPGGTVSIAGTLTAPADEGICEDITGGLLFTVNFTCPGCLPGEAGSDERRGGTSYRVPYECPPGEQTDLVPRFDPDLSRFDIPTGEEPNLTIITWNDGGTPSEPGDTCIQVGYYMTGTIGPFGPSITLFIPIGPEYTYSYPILNPGEHYGEELDFLCTEEMENNTYVVRVNVDCPRPGTTNETDEDNNDDERFLRCVPPEGGNETDGDEEHYSCNVDPNAYTGVPGWTYDFGLTCRDNFLDMDVVCPSTQWTYRETGNASVSDEGNDRSSFNYWVELDPRSRGEGNIHVVAEINFVDGNATCSSDINVPLVPCEEFV